MTTTINADSSNGFKVTADTSSILALQTNGTTAISIDASQAVSFTNSPTVTGGTANGVAYLNGSKVLTTGSALVFNGTNLGVGVSPSSRLTTSGATGTGNGLTIIDTDYSNDTHQIYGNNSLHISAGTGGAGAILFRTAGTERARFNSTGALVLAGGTTTANGIGITFPATQSASTDANTLDDYEEGSWTPSLGGTSTGTFTGKYVKVGKLVTLYSDISVTLIGTGSTTQITGIPFTATSGGSGSLTPSYTVSLATAIVLITAYVDGSTIYIASRTAAAASGSTNAIFGNGTSFSFLCTYIATA